MDQSIYRYADIGLIHFMAYPQCIRGEGPILETLTEIVEDAFFTAVEVTRIKDPQVRKDAAKLLAQSGMRVAFGAQPALLTQKLSLCTLDEAARRTAVDQIKECIDQAYELGAGGLAVLSGPAPADPSRYGEATDRLVDSLLELCAHSAAAGSMPIVLETFDRVPYGKNALVGPTAEAVALSERIRAQYPSFGLMLDLSHAPLLGETSADMVGTGAKHLVHAHIGNCVMRDPAHPAYGDEHPRFGVEGGENGVAELAVFLQELLRVGFMNPERPPIVSFEVKPITAWGETTGVVVANAKRALQQAWAKVQP
jgi:sugar phosphate isomerase/epimerase